MKTIAVALVSAMLSIVAAVAAEPTVKLTGIAQAGGRTRVLLEIKPARGPLLRTTLIRGDRVESVEVVSIDAKAAKVSVKVAGNVEELSFDAGDATGLAPAFRLKDAHSWQVLDLYQELSGRTVIASHSLPAAKITSTSQGAPGDAAAAEALAEALGDQGIAVTPRFDKFAFATTLSYVPRLAQIQEPPVPANDSKVELFPAGLIKFSEADCWQVLDVYQELTGRTLLASPELPNAKISIKSQTALTRDEAIWLMEAVFHLHDITMAPEGTKFTYALPALRNPDPPIIPYNPATDRLKSSKESIAPGALKLNGALPKELLAAYAKLLGREPLLDPAVPALRVSIRNPGVLHPVEAVYALDALAALNHLRFVPVGDNQVKLIHVSQAGKGAANN